MLLKNRSKAFLDAVVAKNLAQAKHSLFKTNFKRLILKRRILELILSFLMIFGGQQLLIQNGFFSPIWPAAAVGLAAIFLRGNFLLVGIFLGSLVSYSVNNIPLIFGLAQSVLLVFFLFLTRVACLKFIGPITPLAKVKVWLGFLAIVALMSFIHILLFFKIFAMTGLLHPTGLHVMLGWLGEVNAILCLVPLSLIFEPFVPQRFFRQSCWPWWVISLSIVGCHFLYYFLPQGIPTFSLSILLLIVLAIYARSFGQLPTCITLFGLSVIYLGGVRPPLSLFHTLCSVTDVTVIIGLFTLSAILCITIATYVQERIQEKYYSNI